MSSPTSSHSQLTASDTGTLFSDPTELNPVQEQPGQPLRHPAERLEYIGLKLGQSIRRVDRAREDLARCALVLYGSVEAGLVGAENPTVLPSLQHLQDITVAYGQQVATSWSEAEWLLTECQRLLAPGRRASARELQRARSARQDAERALSGLRREQSEVHLAWEKWDKVKHVVRRLVHSGSHPGIMQNVEKLNHAMETWRKATTPEKNPQTYFDQADSELGAILGPSQSVEKSSEAAESEEADEPDGLESLWIVECFTS